MLLLYQAQDLMHTNVNCLDMLIVVSAHVPRGEGAKAEEVAP